MVKPAARVLARIAAAVLAAVMVLGPTAAFAHDGRFLPVPTAPAPPDPSTPARTTPFALVDGRDVGDRLPQPEDRYALAGGCYTVEAPGIGFVTRDGTALALTTDPAQALPLHFQPTRLGQLPARDQRGSATRPSRAPGGTCAATSRPPQPPVPVPGGTADAIVAAEPAAAADWAVVAAGADPEATAEDGQTYALTLPSGQALAVADGGLVAGAATHRLRLPPRRRRRPVRRRRQRHRLRRPGRRSSTDTSGRPTPPAPTRPARSRASSRPTCTAWRSSSSAASCAAAARGTRTASSTRSATATENGNLFNGVLEVAVAGTSPSDATVGYDPVGLADVRLLAAARHAHPRAVLLALAGARLPRRPAPDDQPAGRQHRAVPGRTRSRATPATRWTACACRRSACSSCRTTSTRSPAARARAGCASSPRPAQAREVINAGRLAVVLGIEVSVLFDCGEFLDAPQCTTAAASTSASRRSSTWACARWSWSTSSTTRCPASPATAAAPASGRQHRQPLRHRPLLGHAAPARRRRTPTATRTTGTTANAPDDVPRRRPRRRSTCSPARCSTLFGADPRRRRARLPGRSALQHPRPDRARRAPHHRA